MPKASEFEHNVLWEKHFPQAENFILPNEGIYGPQTRGMVAYVGARAEQQEAFRWNCEK